MIQYDEEEGKWVCPPQAPERYGRTDAPKRVEWTEEIWKCGYFFLRIMGVEHLMLPPETQAIQ